MARPSGGKREYLIGRQYGLCALVRAGNIIFTFIAIPSSAGDLYNAVKNVLNHSIRLGGLIYEKDFYGENGKFTMNEFLVGYKTGKPCPNCNTKIEKIKTGSTSSYICPKCQPL